jgi:DNA repair exonuclease SbcCD ATPase subunit
MLAAAMTERAPRDELERLCNELSAARAQLEAAKAARAGRGEASRARLWQAKLERSELARRCGALETRVEELEQERAELEAGRAAEAKAAPAAAPAPKPLIIAIAWSALQVIKWFVR